MRHVGLLFLLLLSACGAEARGAKEIRADLPPTLPALRVVTSLRPAPSSASDSPGTSWISRPVATSQT